MVRELTTKRFLRGRPAIGECCSVVMFSGWLKILCKCPESRVPGPSKK
ncbi:hypothetical protein C4J94_4765 [Pseudomonas sp. R5-89-07]|nr:hypothetical protein C4J94_4765 [Pseudomonas sp. R5-89-07]